MTHVLLLNLPENINDVRNYGALMPPLGLASISSVLKQNNIKTTLIDAAALKINKKKMLSLVEDINPIVLGISLMTHSIDQTIELIREIKSDMQNIIIVVGGPHPTIAYESLLHNNQEIDIAVIGEGEYTLLELTNAIKEKSDITEIKGIALYPFTGAC